MVRLERFSILAYQHACSRASLVQERAERHTLSLASCFSSFFTSTREALSSDLYLRRHEEMYMARLTSPY